MEALGFRAPVLRRTKQRFMGLRLRAESLRYTAPHDMSVIAAPENMCG